MKTANRPQMAAMADARNSAAISRRALAKSKPARSTYATRCRSNAGAAFASDHSSRTAGDLRNGGSLKSPQRRRPERQCQPLATGYREHNRQQCLQRLARVAQRLARVAV